jgi:stearoyl-CoA desaturase (delta-9 desaturase)
VLYSAAGPLRTLFDGWHRPRTNRQHDALAADVCADAYYRLLGRPAPFLLACALHVLIPFGGVYLVWRWTGVIALWATLVLIYNVGDAIDSLAHLSGERPFSAAHRARNNRLLGYLALGEGWHANHHTFPRSARHGLLPGQFDWTWCIIKTLERAWLAEAVVVPAEGEVRERLSEVS